MITSPASRTGALAGLVLMLAGCAGSQQHMARAAIEAHLAQEQTANQMLLLNLVRANLGYPLHFSRIDSMNVVAGDATPTVGLSLGFLAADSNPTRGLTIGATGTRPTLEVTPQDSKEFVQGLTTPLGVDWMAYFVNQGWDMPLVVDLLIERVERGVAAAVPPKKEDTALQPTAANVGQVVAPAEPVKKEEPASTYETDKNALEALRDCSAIELEPAAGNTYGPSVSLAELLDKVSLIDARKAGLSIETAPAARAGESPTDVRFQLREPPSVVVVKFQCKGKVPTEFRANSPSNARLARSAESSLPPPALRGDQYRIVMRSAARMIRHLGSTATEYGASSAGSRAGLIQWRVGEPGAQAEAAVSVVYAGKAYWIDRTDTNTMKSLALMNHVLLLKGSTNEAPSTETVRVRVIPR